MASFAREVLRPLLVEMVGGIVGAFFALLAMMLSAHLLGATPWNLLPGVLGLVFGVQLFKGLFPHAAVLRRTPLDKPE